MGNCSNTSNCNPCGLEFAAINQLVAKAGAYTRQANTYATNAENSWLEFDSLYLGAFAVAPTVDNEGNPLQTGALYWDTVSNELFVWSGTVWIPSGIFNEFTNFISNNSTEDRSLVERFADVVNVKDFGAVGNGVADDTAAFSAACSAAIGSTAASNPVLVTLSPRANIYVPSGNYLLTSLVNTSGKEITYTCDNGAKFLPAVTVSGSGLPPNPGSGLSFINGRIVRDGIHFAANQFGFADTACTLSLKGNPLLLNDELAWNNPYYQPSDVAFLYNNRACCTFNLDNRNPSATINISNAAYTATTITPTFPLTPSQVKLLRVSMIIDTNHPTSYGGLITGWANDGTSITVAGWFEQNNTSVGQIPPNGTGASVNKFTNTFALNPIVWMDADPSNTGKPKNCAVQENDIINALGNYDPSVVTDGRYAWAYDALAKGLFPYNATTAYNVRGRFYNGFLAAGSTLTGSTATDDIGGDQFIGFKYFGNNYGFVFQNRTFNNGVAFQVLNFGTQTVQILPDGDIQGLNTARAWVNFNGNLTTPITPRNGFNVSSITKTGTGQYTINFIVPMLNTNYCTLGSFNDLGAGATTFSTTAWNLNSVSIALSKPGVGTYDHGVVNVAIFNNNY
jgi:hypothetical protein